MADKIFTTAKVKASNGAVIEARVEMGDSYFKVLFSKDAKRVGEVELDFAENSLELGKDNLANLCGVELEAANAAVNNALDDLKNVL